MYYHLVLSSYGDWIQLPRLQLAFLCSGIDNAMCPPWIRCLLHWRRLTHIIFPSLQLPTTTSVLAMEFLRRDISSSTYHYVILPSVVWLREISLLTHVAICRDNINLSSITIINWFCSPGTIHWLSLSLHHCSYISSAAISYQFNYTVTKKHNRDYQPSAIHYQPLFDIIQLFLLTIVKHACSLNHHLVIGY